MLSTIFAKRSILDVWQGSEYVSVSFTEVSGHKCSWKPWNTGLVFKMDLGNRSETFQFLLTTYFLWYVHSKSLKIILRKQRKSKEKVTLERFWYLSNRSLCHYKMEAKVAVLFNPRFLQRDTNWKHMSFCCFKHSYKWRFIRCNKISIHNH